MFVDFVLYYTNLLYRFNSPDLCGNSEFIIVVISRTISFSVIPNPWKSAVDDEMVLVSYRYISDTKNVYVKKLHEILFKFS